MALGTVISLQDVTTEIYGDTNSGRSLNQCFIDSNTAGFSATYEGSKDRLSNFRDYNHAASVATAMFRTTATSNNAAAACGTATATAFWHDGAGAFPLIGDNIYTDASATTLFNGAKKWYAIADSIVPVSNITIKISNTGSVDGEDYCGDAPP